MKWDVSDLATALGFLLIVAGIAWIYPPMALIAAGIGLLVTAILIEMRRARGTSRESSR